MPTDDSLWMPLSSKGRESDKDQTSTRGWDQMRKRLEQYSAALGKGFDPTPEERARILQARARDLAKEETTDDAIREQHEVVEFLLAHEKYALELMHIREVVPLKEYTPLPGTPPFVIGIMNVRGQIMSIIDLKKFFELPELGFSDHNRVIILQSSDMEFGILADEILGLRSISVDSIQASLPSLTGIRSEYLKGVSQDRVVILDAARILSDEKIVVDNELGLSSADVTQE